MDNIMTNLIYEDPQERLKTIFPLIGDVTEGIIEKGSKTIFDCEKCIGARTLRAALGDNTSMFKKLSWSTNIGKSILKDGTAVYICATELESFDSVSVINLRYPRRIVFRLISQEEYQEEYASFVSW